MMRLMRYAAVLLVLLASCSVSRVGGGAAKMTHTRTVETTPGVRRTTTVTPVHSSAGGGISPSAPPGSSSVTHEEIAPGTRTTETVTGEAVGSSGFAAGEKVEQQGTGTPPSLVLPGLADSRSGALGGAQGGGFEFETTATTTSIGAWLVAALLVGSGVYLGVFMVPPRPGLGLLVGLGGVGVAVAAFAPGLMLFAVLGVLAFGAVILWSESRRGSKDRAVARKLVRAVSKLPDDAKNAMKREVGGLTTADEERRIAELKAEEDV